MVRYNMVMLTDLGVPNDIVKKYSKQIAEEDMLQSDIFILLPNKLVTNNNNKDKVYAKWHNNNS